jgi:hypothetical protein
MAKHVSIQNLGTGLQTMMPVEALQTKLCPSLELTLNKLAKKKIRKKTSRGVEPVGIVRRKVDRRNEVLI